MTTSATNYATITADLPDWASDTIDFKLLSSVAISTLEIFPGKIYTMTLDVNGAGTTDLPTPDGDGTLAWLWEVSFPDSREVNISFAWAAVDQDLATLLTAEQSDTTPSDVATLIANKQDKVPGATENNLTSWDAAGQTRDSGIPVTDIGGSIGWLGMSFEFEGTGFPPISSGKFRTNTTNVSLTGTLALSVETYSGMGVENEILSLKVGDYITIAKSSEESVTFELDVDAAITTPGQVGFIVTALAASFGFTTWDVGYVYDIEFTRVSTGTHGYKGTVTGTVMTTTELPNSGDWGIETSGQILYQNISGNIYIMPLVTSYREHVRILEPFVYYPLFELGGSVADDYNGDADFDGTYTSVALGASTFINGDSVGLWDGATSLCNMPQAALNTKFNPDLGSVSIWGKVLNAAEWTSGSSGRLLQLFADNSNRLYISKSSSNNLIECSYQAGGTAKGINISTTTTDWFNVVVTWDTANDRLRIYFNGSQEGADQTSLGTWAGSLIGFCNIGASAAGSIMFSGWLAHCAIFDKELTADEISDLNLT